MSKCFEFKGIPSGDYESFCWDVEKYIFIKIKGQNPDNFDESYFNKGLYRLYPDDFYRDKSECTTTIKIKY